MNAGEQRAANSNGSVTLKVVGESPIDPNNGDQANVNFTFKFSDVRRRSNLLDYTGELRALLTLRNTDRYTGPGLDTPATTIDVPFGITVPCVATPADGTTGSNCATSDERRRCHGECCAGGQARDLEPGPGPGVRRRRGW